MRVKGATNRSGFAAIFIFAIFFASGFQHPANAAGGQLMTTHIAGFGPALYSSGYASSKRAWPSGMLDVPTLSINDVTQAEGNGPNQMIFLVTLDSESAEQVIDQEVTVNFSTTNGSATAPSDFTPIFIDVLTFEPGETVKQIVVDINGDLDPEPDESFFVNLSSPTNAEILDGLGVGTLTNDDSGPAGSLQFNASSYSVNENGGNATITVTRSSGNGGPVTVAYATSNGTATAGQDYTVTSGTLSWGDGETTSKTFSVPIIDDASFEGNETLNLTLSNPTGGASVGTPGAATLTIIDNEGPPLPTLSVSDVSQPEGNGPNQMTFPVTMSQASPQTVTVNVSTADGTATAPSDYTAVPTQVLTFNPGETEKAVPVAINGDLIAEPDESFFLNLSGASNAVIANGHATGTLVNDDAAGVAGSLQFSSLTYSVNENSGTATITVTRLGGSTGAVSVNYATSNGTATAGQDYTATSGALNWADGDASAKNFTIPIIDDASLESNETVNLALSGAGGGATVGSPGTSTLTIVDNDSQPSISINDVSQAEGNGPNQIAFDVTLSAAASQPVSVSYSTANGTATAGQDYTAASGSVTFNTGEVSKQIIISVLGDFDIEPDETFFVNLTNPVGAPIFDSQGVGTLLNDDGAGTIRFESATYSVSESSPTALINVVRSGGLASGVTVQYFSIDGTAQSGQDYTRVSGVLTFAPNQAVQTISVPIIDDAIDESDETVNLALDNPTGGATLGSPINAVLTILDNDDPPVLTVNDVSMNEGDTGLTAFTFTVSLAGQSSQPVTVNYSTANGTAVAPGDYVAVPDSTLTFNPGQTSKQVTVQVKGDYDRESNESFVLNLNNPVGASIGDGQGVGTIVNDDLGGIFRFNSAEYTVGEPGGSLTVTVQRTGGLANSATVNYTTSNGTAIAGQDYTATSGTLTFAGGQTSRTFTVPITNDGVSEPDETFNLILSDATGGATLGVPNTAIVTITDAGQPALGRTLFDYDSDGRADLSVRRPSDNTWYILRGTAGYMSLTYGVTGDAIVPADYDGDGKTDIAVFRPSNGTWYVFNSATQTFSTVGWGADGDLPVPADQDGDGKADFVLFRQSTGTWYTRFANNTFSTVTLGAVGDKPVVGDFDGDGKFDIGLYRPSDNNWYILKSNFGFFVQTWGIAGDIPVPADYDGDGKTDVAVFRPSTGEWFRIKSTAGFDTVNWGQAGDKPIPADYDGDGKADVAVFRPSTGTWYVFGTSAGITQTLFGQNGDVPTEGAFIY